MPLIFFIFYSVPSIYPSLYFPLIFPLSLSFPHYLHFPHFFISAIIFPLSLSFPYYIHFSHFFISPLIFPPFFIFPSLLNFLPPDNKTSLPVDVYLITSYILYLQTYVVSVSCLLYIYSTINIGLLPPRAV